MPKPFPAEFRADVIARACKGEAPLRQIAKDFGISEVCLHRWLKIAHRQDGLDRPGSAAAGDDVSAQLRKAHKRIKLLEQKAEVMRRARGYLSRDAHPKSRTRWSSPLPLTAARHGDLPGPWLFHSGVLQLAESAFGAA